MDRSITIGIHGAIKAPCEQKRPVSYLPPSLGGYELCKLIGLARAQMPPQLTQFVNASMYSATSCLIGSER